MLRIPGPFDDVANFKEDDSLFTADRPYLLWQKKYNNEGEKIILHFHDSYEIIASENVSGERFISGQRYRFKGKSVFVIPPHELHSATININSGQSLILKFSPEHISNYINIDKLFAFSGCRLNHAAITSSSYGEIFEQVKILHNTDDANVFDTLFIFVTIFKVLSKTCEPGKFRANPYNKKIRDLIEWSKKNYSAKNSLEESAQFIGFSKNYFCKYFKKNTGSTYLNYINQIKLEEAAMMLKKGNNVTEVCYCCGFDNVSYFIQLFKKYFGTTPKQYAKTHINQ